MHFNASSSAMHPENAFPLYFALPHNLELQLLAYASYCADEISVILGIGKD
jgi:hypothetical protein